MNKYIVTLDDKECPDKKSLEDLIGCTAMKNWKVEKYKSEPTFKEVAAHMSKTCYDNAGTRKSVDDCGRCVYKDSCFYSVGRVVDTVKILRAYKKAKPQS